MEFGKHLGKGLWGIADKALAVIYGVGFVYLVIRVLPEEELGNFVLLQELFLIITGFANALALQPLLKFLSEDSHDQRGVMTVSLLINVIFIVVSAVLVLLFRDGLGSLFNSSGLSMYLVAMPALLATSFVRNYTLVLLQSRLQTRPLFWTDAAHFVGFPFLIWVFSKFNAFHTAGDLIFINLITFSFSSLVGLWTTRSLMRFTLRPDPQDVRKVWDYGKYSLGGIVSYLFYSRADSFILATFTGPVQVGIYSSAKIFVRIYEMVLQVVQMFILPLTSKLSSLGELDKLKAVLEKATAFTTVALLPVTAVLMFMSPLVLEIVYHGRYTEAVPMLQIFSILTFLVPITAVGSNTLMGLGHAKRGFIIGVQVLFASIVMYTVCILWWEALGAVIGYVISSLVLAILTTWRMVEYVPLSFRGVVRRTNDIVEFVRIHLRREA